MDEFGVLTERFGLKPQGKSAPMASSKQPSNSINAQRRNFGSNSSLNPKPGLNSNSFSGSFLDDQEMLFSNHKPQNLGGFLDNVHMLGGFQKSSSNTDTNGFGFDFDPVFSNTNNSIPKSSFDDDIFVGLTSGSNSVVSNDDGIFGPFPASKPNDSGPIDDLLENLSSKTKNLSRDELSDTDDLIPGFDSRKGENMRVAASAYKTAEDPFVVLESGSTSAFFDPLEEISRLNCSASERCSGSSNISQPLRPPPKPGQVLKTDKSKSSDMSSIEELEDFVMGRVRNNADGNSNLHGAGEVKGRQSDKLSKYKEAEGTAWQTQEKGADDFESFFGIYSWASSVSKEGNPAPDPLFDMKSFGASSGIKSSSTDLSSMFGDYSPYGEFEEVKGDTEERRRLRLERHQRTQDRVLKAVNDMNLRDLQMLHEQEERLRISENIDIEIKRWAAGKEGNMRALLSSLQYVLWPECGWEPVSLTDLISSTSVKKVYRKATLCIHPDKVQQKCATVPQKYTAEKVFDILKEAWKKFQKEELS